MKEFVEKLIERLEELKEIEGKKCDKYAKLNMGDYVETYNHGECCYLKAIQIVNQLAEEFGGDINVGSKAEQIAEDLSAVLKEAKSMGCKEVKYFHHIPLENVEIAIKAFMAYAGKYDSELVEKINFAIEASNTKDNYMTGLRNGMRYCLALIDGKEPEFEECNQDSTQNNKGWILCSERLPDIDNKAEFYPTVIVTKNKYGEVGFGFHDGEDWYVFNDYTTEWDKYKNIKAWQPLPEPYKPEEKQEETQTNFYSERFNRVI